MNALPAKQSRPRLLACVFLSGVLLVSATAGVAYYLGRPGVDDGPVPPGADLDGVEAAVRENVLGARSRVLANPRSADAWGTLGEVLLANELEPESNICFARAERLDPANPRWPYYLAGSLLNQGEREAALPGLRRAVERCDRDEDGPPRLLLGETLLILGRSEEAEDCFRQVLARQPDDPRAHFDMGLLLISRQDWARAREQLLRCLGAPSARQKARIQLAQVCRRLDDVPAADEFLQQADRMPKDTDWPDPFVEDSLRWAVKKKGRFKLAEQLEAGGNYAEAARVLRPLTTAYPDDYLPFLFLGRVLAPMGELARAEQALRTALRLAPDKVQVYYYLSLVLSMQGDRLSARKEADSAEARALFMQSAELADKALQRKPDYGFAHMSLGLALKGLGRRADALAELRQAVRCTPEYAELHFYLGDALAEAGQTEEARARLEQALRQADPRANGGSTKGSAGTGAAYDAKPQPNWVFAARARLDALNKDGKAK